MSELDGFHPDLTTTSAEHGPASLSTRVHHVRASDVSSGTAQTAGMRRFAAISGGSVGSEKIWMGETYVSPEAGSGDHHHRGNDTAVFVRSGDPAVVIHDGHGGIRTAAAPGGTCVVPPSSSAP